MNHNDNEDFIARDYRTLAVWKRSMTLCENIYSLTKQFPKHELYALGSQGQRSSSSVPLNIAEGNSFQLYPRKQMAFYSNALGSLQETRCFLELSLRLGYIEQGVFDKLDAEAQELVRMLVGMIKRVKSKIA
ncbi:four helix bundle protein [Alicyclobacillus acidoterrestris]|uniref:Four helix bundle protein n=1 Tax=Alicyclobacillus acidoterrestris (strain ATCC 49025 / DSM 3922 / CIP 106132 / NCIMB 13137 / GD3B) TaxID=1356854 RepID=T0CJX8_ALIAG|nr:four helix bundle protein [Alicyclobacillus acidoterrestris]EPZ53084.1 hypothetical protein N007_18315 [Alicyclobacillus acidoterrestris ATCC 49025]UNO49378.1 four helix bundle protein [Alicyclobacillus acidoterrestris]